ncbi:response regulator transcription factor [Flavitalea sp. BT771]|uniref:response regulator transcription factor n=1 Tax=Flavitalea sp. BT771 TaxID=3063329 RepID=UPI0026E1E1B5|nr:response regulator transcription factor [Flavitalea sp. BT771]MDO6434422.1 response regulator transcription factor [Flavitalea sp. BT771]MDV6223322.1 response regulator transcription factor [Flavitalea sp. BT771]
MRKIKVLYVEDELFLGKIVKESLESRGFEVVMENDGAKVLPSFTKLRPDVCVLDVMLPNKDGFEIAEEIRGLDKEVPILFVTAKGRTEDVVRGFTLGGNDYIRKPFSMEEMIVRIHNTLRSKGGAAVALSDGPVSIGKYRFLWKRQVLALGDAERKLSFRENELLKFLYAHRDKVIDRKDVLQLLWGNDSFFNSRNLDVYITKIRSYLKEDDSLEIITIKGVGYRFIL